MLSLEHPVRCKEICLSSSGIKGQDEAAPGCKLLLECVPWKNLLLNLCQESQQGIRAMGRTGAGWGSFHVMDKMKTGLDLIIAAALSVLV